MKLTTNQQWINCAKTNMNQTSISVRLLILWRNKKYRDILNSIIVLRRNPKEMKLFCRSNNNSFSIFPLFTFIFIWWWWQESLFIVEILNKIYKLSVNCKNIDILSFDFCSFAVAERASFVCPPYIFHVSYFSPLFS